MQDTPKLLLVNLFSSNCHFSELSSRNFLDFRLPFLLEKGWSMMSKKIIKELLEELGREEDYGSQKQQRTAFHKVDFLFYWCNRDVMMHPHLLENEAPYSFCEQRN